MRPPGDPAGGSPPEKSGGALDELHQTPTAQEEKGGDMDEKRYEKDGDQSNYPGGGIEQEIGAHHTGYSPGSANGRRGLKGVGEDMDQPGSHPAREIKKEKTERPHPVFNIIPKKPKGPHITNQVSPVSMEKHAGKKGDKRHSAGKIQSQYPGGNQAVCEKKPFCRHRRKGNRIQKR